MADSPDNESLMIRLINLLSERFPAQAILRGGMELRLLNCPRRTNDLDYVFIPFSSKKEIVQPILDALSQQDLIVSHVMHSTCLQIIVTSGTARVQLEFSVASDCASQELSTGDFARRHNMQGRVIRVMGLSVALSHKLAAWLERGLLRDLYDVHFIHEALSVRPDIPTLKDRLANVHYQRKGARGPRSMSLPQFANALLDEAASLTSQSVERELSGVIDKDELPGLDLKIRKALKRIAEILETD